MSVILLNKSEKSVNTEKIGINGRSEIPILDLPSFLLNWVYFLKILFSYVDVVDCSVVDIHHLLLDLLIISLILIIVSE